MIALLLVLGCGMHHAQFPLLGAGEDWTYGPSATVDGVAYFVRIDEAGWLQTASTGGAGASRIEFRTATRVSGAPKSLPTFGQFDESMRPVDDWVLVATLDESWYVNLFEVYYGALIPGITLIGRDETCAEATGIGSVGLLQPRRASGYVATAHCEHSGTWMAHAWLQDTSVVQPRGSWVGVPHQPSFSLAVPRQGSSPPVPAVAGEAPWVAVVESGIKGWQVTAHSLRTDAGVVRLEASSQVGERVWLGPAATSADGFLLPVVASDADHQNATVCITHFSPSQARELACHPFEGDLVEGLTAPVRVGETAGPSVFAWSTKGGAGVVACDDRSCGPAASASIPWRGCSLGAVAALSPAAALVWDCPVASGRATLLRKVQLGSPRARSPSRRTSFRPPPLALQHAVPFAVEDHGPAGAGVARFAGVAGVAAGGDQAGGVDDRAGVDHGVAVAGGAGREAGSGIVVGGRVVGGGERRLVREREGLPAAAAGGAQAEGGGEQEAAERDHPGHSSVQVPVQDSVAAGQS